MGMLHVIGIILNAAHLKLYTFKQIVLIGIVSFDRKYYTFMQLFWVSRITVEW